MFLQMTFMQTYSKEQERNSKLFLGIRFNAKGKTRYLTYRYTPRFSSLNKMLLIGKNGRRSSKEPFKTFGKRIKKEKAVGSFRN